MQRKKLGYLGEDMAKEFLKNAGYTIICQNYTVRGGEIDIVAKDGNTIIFAEVKTRKNDLFGKASEAVDSKKISHMCTAAKRFLYENKEFENSSVRFDVLEVYTQKGIINHIVNIDIN